MAKASKDDKKEASVKQERHKKEYELPGQTKDAPEEVLLSSKPAASRCVLVKHPLKTPLPASSNAVSSCGTRQLPRRSLPASEPRKVAPAAIQLK